MRISDRAILPALLLLGACGGGGDPSAPPAARADAPPATPISCTLAGDARAQTCTVERGRAGDRVELVLHHPDGGFRRLLVTPDGRGITTADGASRATVRLLSAREIEIAVEGDRYRLPAAAPAGS